MDALEDVNDLQQKASQASTDLATGKIEDISQVVIAAEKAAVTSTDNPGAQQNVGIVPGNDADASLTAR